MIVPASECCSFYFSRKVSASKQFIFSYDDSLTLYDGDSDAAPMIGMYCGQTLPPSFVSSKNEIFMHFQSDDHGSNNGFKLKYEAYSKL